MRATELLAALRGRGFTFRVDQPVDGQPMRLLVRPAAGLTAEERHELRANKPALVALLEAEAAAPAVPQRLWEPDVMTALEVFPGAQVVAHNVRAVWPPPDGWILSPARRVDSYSTAPPTVACPTCSGSDWHRAGDGWTCGVCHPSPHCSPHQEAHQHEPGILRDTVRCPSCAGPEGPRA
jgi:hypothetical protein